MPVIKTAAVQMDISWENRHENFEKVRSLGLRAKEDGADVLILPEMFSTGFSMNPAVTAETPNGLTPTFMKELAVELGMLVIGGYVQIRRDGKGANLAVAIDENGSVLAEYGKAHLFSFLNEGDSHEAGAGPRPFNWRGLDIACFVCYDIRFPELFRLVADQAALIIVIASWPVARQAHWDILLSARAIENQLYLMGVNRVGKGGGLEYSGGSAIIDPQGKTIAHGSEQEGLVIANIDTDFVTLTREKFPFLKDRRF